MPLEPKLASCGWQCPHRRPAFTGPFGTTWLWFPNPFTLFHLAVFRDGLEVRDLWHFLLWHIMNCSRMSVTL